MVRLSHTKERPQRREQVHALRRRTLHDAMDARGKFMEFLEGASLIIGDKATAYLIMSHLLLMLHKGELQLPIF